MSLAPVSSTPNQVVRITFQLFPFDNSGEGMHAKEALEELVAELDFPGTVFVWSEMYEMLEVTVPDMLRNIGLTVLAVFLCNLLLTVDLTTSLLSLAVVGLTVTRHRRPLLLLGAPPQL